MSISSALNNALTGLIASSRAADIVSSNVANAMTEGYGVRGLELGASTNGRDGAGVRVHGVLRESDPVLLGQRRDADAARARAGTEAGLRRQIEKAFGLPDNPASLAARLADFEARLVDAANGPHDEIRLGVAVDSAVQLASAFRDASAQVQAERKRADAAIGMAVATINESLSGLADLNEKILATKHASGELASLLDAQTRLIDQISPLIKIETRRQSNGSLQVFSTGGEFLVDRRAAVLEFQNAPIIITPRMRYPSTIQLSGIVIQGRDMAMGASNSKLGGGELDALFKVRDTWAVDAQDQLDAMARNLIERFEQNGDDPTRPTFDLLIPTYPDAGLFTDRGQPITQALMLDSDEEHGLASRIFVNEAVLPDTTDGDVRRLRDGLLFNYSLNSPIIGDPDYLKDQIDTLLASRQVSSGNFANSERSMAGLVTDQISLVTQARQLADQSEVNRVAVHSALREEELSKGVDTDAEMQNLLRIESIYAANARVVQAADAMLDELIRMT